MLTRVSINQAMIPQLAKESIAAVMDVARNHARNPIVLKPLFHLASKTLCINGKLVFGFFNYPGNEKCYWSVDDLPKHDNLKVENICREEWKYSSGHILARDIVVVKRVSA